MRFDSISACLKMLSLARHFELSQVCLAILTQVMANSSSRSEAKAATTFKALLVDQWDFTEIGKSASSTRILVHPRHALRCMVGNHDFTDCLGDLWSKGKVVSFALYAPWAPETAAKLLWTGPGNKRSKVWQRLKIRGRDVARMVSPH